jgi:prepilin-type processing-associated H-X9-DG protein
MLPMLGHNGLFASLKLDEAWDTATNKSLLASPKILQYQCPTDRSHQRPSTTHYLAITGPDSLWGKEARTSREGNIPNPAVVAEVLESDIGWGEPRDMTFEEACRGVNCGTVSGIASRHVVPGGLFFHDQCGAHVLFADGSVEFITTETPPDLLRAVLRGEPESLAELKSFQRDYTGRIHWANCTAVAVLAASLLGLLVPARPNRH